MSFQIRKEVEERLESLRKRLEEIETFLSDSRNASDPRYASYVREHGRTLGVVRKYDELKTVTRQRLDAEVIIETETDDEFLKFAQEEAVDLQAREETLYSELLDAVLSEEDDADRNIIMEIRAGTGGDEACLFAADLFRLYSRYAESKGWKVEIMSSNSTDLGGYKEIVLGVSGPGAFGHLRFESGTHRVQRVPETEASGRIHTSAATVAVLPEPEEIDVDIRQEDLKIDTYRSSGPGGQHANKVSSAIRITHIPSGTVVTCEDEKSQHKNKARALRILRSRIYDTRKREQDEKMGQARRDQIGSGDRSEKIRTYNFPQNRVTDHRIGFSVHSLDKVLEGEIGEVIEALRERHKQARIGALSTV